jgi:flagellin
VIDLNIRSLSEESVGDTGGAMSYSSGQNNVFLNLSSSTANAATTDTLNTLGTTTIDVSYLVQGSNGTSTTASTTITAGGTTSYANTAAGLISAINSSGLGLTATFATQAQAGVAGGGTQTGIEISGAVVSAGVDPSSASTSGILDPTGIPAGQLLTQGQTVTVKVGSVTAASVQISPTVNDLQQLANAINFNDPSHPTTQNSLVTASVITNGDGSQSLSLADTSKGGALSVTTEPGTGAAVPTFTSGNAPTNSATFSSGTAVAGNAVTPPTQSSFTIGTGGTGNAGTDKLALGGSITIMNSESGTATTFVVGAGADNTPANTYYTANHGGNTLADLATTISSVNGLDVTATVDPGGTGIIVKANHALTGENLTVVGSPTLNNANQILGLYSPVDGGAAGIGTPQITALDSGSALATQDDVLNTGGAITLTNALGTTTFTATAGQTYADLAQQINGSNLGVTAQWSVADHALLLTSAGNGADPVVASVNSLTDTSFGGAVVVDNANGGYQLGTAGPSATFGTAILQLPNNGTINDGGDTLTGQIELQNGAGTAVTFIMGPGTDSPGTNTYYTTLNTVASLVAKINSVGGLGIYAIAPGGAGTGAIYLQSTTPGAGHIISTPGVTTLADAKAENATAPSTGVTLIAGNVSTLAVNVVNNGTNNGVLSTSDLLAVNGTITLKNGGVTHTFTIGAGTDNIPAGTYYTANFGDHTNSLANLAATISADTTLGVKAQANTSGLALTSSAFEGAPGITMVSSSLADQTEGSYSTVTLGSFASKSDTISGSINFTVNGQTQPVPTTAGETVGGLIDYINLNKGNLGVWAQWVAGTNGFGSVELTSNTIGSGGLISGATTTITDTTATAALSYTATSAYNTGVTSDSTYKVYDSTSEQSSTNQATFIADSKSGSGVAITSYSDGAGQALNGTDLLNQMDARSALAVLNNAITDVAAQDGYIGAEINTLNSISQVMSTQQENVVSAQNALQATDYASATSNMSKYEILSQTGIAALAQANSVQQEVTKLLQ